MSDTPNVWDRFQAALHERHVYTDDEILEIWSGGPGTRPVLGKQKVLSFARNLLGNLERELATCKAELDRERMRLVACGVVARANMPESAANARSMDNDYRSASCEDVADAVDEQMRLRAELARAMRVVNAAKTYKDDDSYDDTRSLSLLLDAVEKWEAGQ